MDDTLSMDRRALLGLGGGAALMLASGPAAAAASTGLASLGSEIVRLWPGRAPGHLGKPIVLDIAGDRGPARPDRLLSGIDEPVMVVHRPARPNGAGALVIPGGGYVGEVYDNEGTRQAAWLNARGITAFILVYRLPAEGWVKRSDVPLQDAQRALRLIRVRADRFGVRGDRLMVLGFSAGGHLAGSIATRFDAAVYAPVDAADRLSARPDLAAMIYPVVSLCPPVTHAGSREALIGADADRALCELYSVDRLVSANTPPVFLLHTGDDSVVPIENSLLMYRAMLDKKRSVAMHLFEKGGHGFGVNLPRSEPVAAWPDLLAAFAASHGLLAG